MKTKTPKAPMLFGIRMRVNSFGEYSKKFGSQCSVTIAPSNDGPSPDFYIQVRVFGDVVIVGYKPTAQAAANFVERKLKQLFKGLANGYR